MEKYKNKPKALKAWVMKNREILLWLNTDGSQWMDMVKQTIGETATVGGTSAGDVSVITSVPGAKRKVGKGKNGLPKAPQATNADGTAKNALDMTANVMGGKAIKR